MNAKGDPVPHFLPSCTVLFFNSSSFFSFFFFPYHLYSSFPSSSISQFSHYLFKIFFTFKANLIAALDTVSKKNDGINYSRFGYLVSGSIEVLNAMAMPYGTYVRACMTECVCEWWSLQF